MRVAGWEQRLADLVADAQTRAFQYGTWDCCLFAASAIAAVTGHDPAAAFRGRYADEAGCRTVLAESGGILSIADRAAGECGFPTIRVREAHRGDIVLGKINGLPTLGVCVGGRAVFAVAPRGITALPLSTPGLLRAWRIA